MDNQVSNYKYNYMYNKNNQPTLRLRYSRYLRNSTNRNKISKTDPSKILSELEVENAELEKIINLLEFKNKILEENCHFLKEKNYYIERKLREIEVNDLDVNNESSVQKNCSENKIEENTLGKFTYFKERISGAIFGFIVPNLSKICRKVKEKRDEIKEFIEEQGFPHREHNIDCPIKKIGFDKKITALKVNLYRVVIVLGTLMVISGVGYAGYKIWKNRFRHPAYLVPSEDEDDDSGDEIFRAPGTSRGVENASMVKTQSTESFSTDFKSILDTANNK